MICCVSSYAGFCFGVALAVNSAYENARDGACMLGEIVHNPTVVGELEKLGMRRVETSDDVRPGEKVLIRAHGVTQSVIAKLESLSVSIIDRTCPKVKRIHDIVAKASNESKRILIVGNPNHPEVIGIMGWCSNAKVVQSENDAMLIATNPDYGKSRICLVSQTTFNKAKYLAIRDILVESGLPVDYHDTICLDTSNRQREVSQYAQKVDCVIVVGGKNSSNSTKLFEIASQSCKKAIHVEEAKDIALDEVLGYDSVFVTGGASTPIDNCLLAVDMLKKECELKGLPFEMVSA